MTTDERNPLLAFDWTTFESVPAAVVAAVAAVEDGDPLQLAPLEHAIDTDGLNALFDRAAGLAAARTGTIRFEYLDYEVVVDAGNRGYVYPKGDGERAPVGEPTGAVLTGSD